MTTERIIIVGGPRTGKSTLAQEYRRNGIPTFCGDPSSKVKDLESDVTYLPEGLEWSASSQYVCDHWFTKSGPWLCEGHIMARALRKWRARGTGATPADRIIVMTSHHPSATLLGGHRTMQKGVMSVWSQIRNNFASITEYVSHGSKSSTPPRRLRHLRGRL